MTQECPVCEIALIKTEVQGDRHFFECPRCGPFSLSRSAMVTVQGELGRVPNGQAILSHAIYKMTQRDSSWPMLTSENLKQILSQTILPRPQQQLENLILWLGSTQPDQGVPIEIQNRTLSAIGATNMASLGFIVGHAIERGLVAGKVLRSVDGGYHYTPIHLTFDGWVFYEELQRGHNITRTAFMAMQFGDSELNHVYESCFKPAVGDTGFTLKKLDEQQPAGLIDDRLRVEIRQARFLIADLTHQNKGAYWEAGFAEGLGRPVVYTCRKDVFEDKNKGPHFDTNHHLTVVWEPNKLDEAASRLKNTIRATLPDEAKLSD